MKSGRQNYSRIIQSSSLIGGAQGVNILIGMIRVKFVALLLGPIGLGLISTYQSITLLIGTIAGLGLQSSAVRDIAQAVESKNKAKLDRTIITLRRMCWLSGGIGSLLVILFSPFISQITFRSNDHIYQIAFISIIILTNNIRGGHLALIQGMRLIKDLAKINILSASIGTCLCVIIYIFLGVNGIVPAILLLSITELAISWLFARKIVVNKIDITWGGSFRAAGGMINLGLALMWSSLLTASVAYCARVIISAELNLVAIGIYTAAFTLSGMYVSFVLQAMGADYYPNLTSVSTNHKKMKELVNQQTEVGLLLSMPGILATLSLAPWMVKIFYSSEFHQAADLIQWFVLGCLGQVICWPMGFIFLALGQASRFAILQTWAQMIHFIFIFIMLDLTGIEGVAIAYFFLYFIHTPLLLLVSKNLINFKWNYKVIKLLIFFTPLTIITFFIGRFFNIYLSTFIGITLTLATLIFCLREIYKCLGDNHKICVSLQKNPFIKPLLPTLQTQNIDY